MPPVVTKERFRKPRSRLPDGNKPTEQEKKVAEQITPEALAYALPGGLARLNNPSWMYARHLRLIEDNILPIVKGKPVRLIVTMPPRHGKSCYDGTPVLTTKGWTTHGELEVGDKVFSPDGRPTKVVKLSPKVQECVPVELSNGETIWCHLNHEWEVYDRGRSEWLVKETRELKDRVHLGNRNNFMLPDVKAVRFPKKDLPLNPYVLGVWLGDGSSASTRICHDRRDPWVIEEIERLGFHPRQRYIHNKYSNVAYAEFSGKRGGGGSPMFRALKGLNVLNNKHIPEIYLRSSRKQRLKLLAGLIDSDGHVDKVGRCRIVTTREALRDGIMDLCTSLGFRPYFSKAEPVVSTSGIRGRKPCYTIGFQPTCKIPTKVPRKKVGRSGVRRRVSIVNIGEPEKKSARSIMVDNDDGMYLVGKKLNPTHNTVFISRNVPAWFVGRYPDKRVMLITHTIDYSRTQGRYARNILKRYGKPVFDVRVADDTAAAGHWEIQDREGGMESLGALSNLQGRGADLLLIDDIVKGYKMALNTTLLEEQWEWLQTDVMSRLEPNASIIITITRWSTIDVVGQIIEAMKNDPWAEQFKIINLAALAEEENDPLGRKYGEALWPERWNEKYLEGRKHNMLPYWWDALYRGQPAPSKGSIIQIDWFQRYTQPPNREDCDLCVISIDTAIKETELSDFSVFEIFFVKDGDSFLIDVIRERMSFPILLQTVLELNGRLALRPDIFLIEDKGSGTSLIQQLQRQYGEVNSMGINPGNESKIIRAETETPSLRAGKVHLPNESPWLETFLEEMRTFPTGRKDQVDSLSQYLKWMREQGHGIDVF